jgi:PAS domain S-box-containing protein
MKTSHHPAPEDALDERRIKDRSLDELMNDLDAGGSIRHHQGTQVDVIEVRRLVHELQSHQVELEVQNRELREAQGLLEESRARYVELYDRAPVGYLTLRPNGAIGEINLTGANLLGTDRSRLIGRWFRAFLADDSPAAFDQHLRRCLLGHGQATVEVAFKSPRGRVVELLSVPVHDANGVAIATHTAMTDVSERRQAEVERARLLAREREARALAEKASRVREDFLAVVSHELRTPLAPMLMWMGVLRSSGPDDALRSRALATLEMCLKAQVSQIDDLVDLARSTNGKLRIDPRAMSLAPLIDNAVEAVALSASAKRIQVKRTGVASSCRVWGDPARLRQVIANLLSNAIKFTPDQGNIVVRLAQQGDNAVLSVEDDGEGIEAALLPHVFEPFRQQDVTRVRRHAGLGLGLAIVHELVRLHGGTVRAASPGRNLGATFTVTLPLIDIGAPVEASPAVVAHELTGARSALAGVRILVVEDQPQTREVLTLVLRQSGAEVIAAGSAAAGRAALAANAFEVILCDIAMPDEDGYSFIRQLRAQEAQNEADAPHALALALTAHATPEDRRLALEAGFDLHRAKPLDPDDLIAIIAHRREGGA